MIRHFLLFLVFRVSCLMALENSPLIEEESSDEEQQAYQYYLDAGAAIIIVPSMVGISVGTLMAGAECLGSDQVLTPALCTAGIAIAASFGTYFVIGLMALGSGYAYKYYVFYHDQEKDLLVDYP